MAYKIIAQVIGAVALTCSLLAFQQKKRGGIMAMQMAASILFSVQYLMLGAYTGAALDLLSFIRTAVFSNNGKKGWAAHPAWLAAFIAIMIAAGIFTWNNIYSLLAIAGSVLSTVALWMKKAKHVRLVSAFVAPCWFTYNIVNGAYMGALNEVIALASIITGMVRHDIKKKESEA